MTFSIQVTETQRGERRALKGKKNITELSTLEWHTLPADEVCQRLGVAPNLGLDGTMAARRLAKNGKNVISPPPKNLAKKVRHVSQTREDQLLIYSWSRSLSTSSEGSAPC